MHVGRILGRFGLALLSALLVIAVAGAWIGTSTSFLRWALAQAETSMGGALETGEVHGTLVGGATLDRLAWRSGETQVEAHGLRLGWRPEWLLAGQLRLRELRAERIDIVLGPGGGGGPPGLPERLVLPVAVGVDELAVGRLNVRGADFVAPEIEGLAATLRHDGTAWNLRRLHAQIAGWGELDGSARLAAQPPFAVQLDLRAQPALAAYPDLPPLLLQAGGPLSELPLRVRMPAPAGRVSAGEPGGGADWLRAETTLRAFEAVPLRALRLELDGFEPDTIGLPGPHARLSGALDLALDDDAAAAADVSLLELPWTGRLNLRNSLPGAIDAGLLPVSSLDTGIDWRDGRLSFDALDVDGGLVKGALRLDTGSSQPLFGIELPAIDARLELRGLDLSAWSGAAWPTQLAGTVALARDRIELSVDDTLRAGAPKNGAAKNGAAPGRASQPAGVRSAVSAKASARLDGELLRIESLKLATPAGSVEAAGTASWQSPWRGDLSGRFADLAPARLAAIVGVELPAQLESLQALAGDWSVSGEFAPALGLDTRMRIASGRYQDRPLRLDWRGRVAQDRLGAIALTVMLGELVASASGDAGRGGDRLRIELRAPKLEALDPALSGALRARGDLMLNGLGAKALAAAEVDLDIDGQRLLYAGRRLDRANVSIQGTLAAHRLELSVAGEPATARLNAQGRLDVPGVTAAAADADNAGAPAWRWVGSVERFASTAPLAVTLANPMPVIVDGGGVEAGPAALTGDDGRLELVRLVYRGGRFEVAGDAQRLPVSRWAEQFGLVPAQAASVDEIRLGGNWRLAGSSIDDLDGSASLRIVTTRKVDGDGTAELRFERGQVAGKLDLRLPSLAFANAIVGAEWGVDGRLRVVADVAGTLREPKLVGTLEGRELAFRQNRLGWRFENGALDARFDGDGLQVDSLRLASGDGAVTLSGALRLADMDTRFRLLAERLPVPIGPGQRIVVSGDTRITGRANEMLWSGKIGVDEGLIELRGGDAPTLPDDVVIVDSSGRTVAATPAGAPARAPARGTAGQAPSPASSASSASPASAADSKFVLHADLEAALGEKLRVRGRGVDARLSGSLRLHGTLPGAPRANGTVRVRDGVFQAYGQKLEISRGRVIFNGPIDNPVLDITAMRRGTLVEAGVAVTGTVLSPRIRLVSEPEVPDAQKLSWLVLGVGIDDARSGAQTAALTAAAATLFGSNDGGLGGGLAQSLGLDVLTIRNASNDPFGADFGANFPTQAGTSTTSTLGTAQDVVAIGKRLGSNVIVTYEQGLRGVWSLLRLQYDITRRLSVRAQTGTDTAIDLLYFLSFD